MRSTTSLLKPCYWTLLKVMIIYFEFEKEKSKRKEHEITKNAISLDPVDHIVRLLAHIVALHFLHKMG